MESISLKKNIVGAVDSHIGGRKENQDHYMYSDTPLGPLVVVCDGMGGGPAGKTASSLAAESILTHVVSSLPSDNPAKVLESAIRMANQVLNDTIAANPHLSGMGTTCVCLLLSDGMAYIGHVGDSRCYQLRKHKVRFRTTDHSQVAELVKQGVLTEEQARVSPYSNIITRAIGIQPMVQPEIDKISYKMGDRFALMTDGIWGTVSEPILVSELTESSSAENTVAGLVERTDGRGKRKGGKHDNLTLAVIDVEADPIDKRNIWKYMFLCIMGCMVVLVLISGFRWLNAKSVTGQVVAESDTSKEVISDMKSGEEPQISSVDNFDTVDNQPVEVVNPSGNQSNRPKTSLVTVDITSGTEILGCISEIKQTLETLKNYGVDNVISQKNNRTAWNECKSHREALLNDVLTNLGTLAKKCDDPMKMHVKEIINLLKDKNSKVIYPDKKYGRTTREGAEVIDESIKKLNKLTNQ